MTGAQRNVLAAAAAWWDDRGYPPTVRELCEATRLSSPSTVHRHLQNLAAAGLIALRGRRMRTLTITPAGRDALADRWSTA